MDEKSNNSRLLLALLMALLSGIKVLQYVCPGTDCQLQLRLISLSKMNELTSGIRRGSIDRNREVTGWDPYVSKDTTLARFVPRFNFSTDDLKRTVDFDIKGNGVIVFLHIQKTGAPFGRHLVRNIQLERPCECRTGQKRCTCYRPGKREPWLFSRFSTGWSCGLHADWTELTSCVPSRMYTSGQSNPFKVPSRSYHYITILRDPLLRYLSEWRHVQRGATWKASLHVCDGRGPTLAELPPCYPGDDWSGCYPGDDWSGCYPGDDWSGCSLEELLDCPYNLANNRTTRMLSDLSLEGCYNLSALSERERSAALLESTKRSLRGLAFFGLTEFQRKTQYLLEHTFRLAFIAPFTQLNGTRAAGVEAGPEMQQRFRELNRLDVELYEYVRDLFLQRVQVTRQRGRKRAHRRRQRHGDQQRARLQRPHRPETRLPPPPVQSETPQAKDTHPPGSRPMRDPTGQRRTSLRLPSNERPHRPETRIPRLPSNQRPHRPGTHIPPAPVQ